jgi:hypothetical protein
MTVRNLGSLKTAVAAASAAMAPPWLWTWGGVSFGYRRGDSLFTYDGVEVGRFSGTEIFGADGLYVGELRNAEDGERLITHSYKKSRSAAGFYPMRDQAYSKPADRSEEPLYAGHEDFPTPKMMKKSAARA